MTTTHDELAYAVATEAVGAIRAAQAPWSTIFSPDCHVTSSRDWPVPDFVLNDLANKVTAAGEFKPPGQSKREYLTGLGQAMAYTRSFDYGILVVPEIADDAYQIANHLTEILTLPDYASAPIILIRYDPATITDQSAASAIAYFPTLRGSRPLRSASVGSTFYAKWRDISPEEMACFLRHLYLEATAPTSASGHIRDRAWESVWDEIQAGRLHHWGGETRRVSNTSKSKQGWMKNWRNFMNHVGWMETNGALTELGLRALHTVHIYNHDSQMFLDLLARSLLTEGKHLIFINAINDYQDKYLSSHGPFADEQSWLLGTEIYLEDKGLLKRNPGRHRAATQNVSREFLKAEKTLWRNLGLIAPRGFRTYHRGRGFIFDWSRITSLLRG